MIELASLGIRVARDVLRLQSCLAEQVIVPTHDLTGLMCPTETAALESFSSGDIRALEDDFTAIFDSGDAVLYRDQVLAISNYERLLESNVPLRSGRAGSMGVAISEAEKETVHRMLQAILESRGTAVKAFITSKLEVCHRLVRLRAELARQYAIIPVGSLYPGVVSINAAFDNLIKSLCAHPHYLHHLEARQFEELVAEIWARMGYQVELTPETRDGGRDIVASKNDEVKSQVLIECKRYNAGRPVGVAVAQRMLGAVAQYDASQGVIATTSTFTREAIKVIGLKQNRLTGHEFTDLINLLWRVQMVIIPRVALPRILRSP